MPLDIIMIGIALSMDAFAVTLSSSMTFPGLSPIKRLCMPAAFALAQGIMPILGYKLGNIFSSFLIAYSGIITCIILCIIGGNMIKEGICHEETEQKPFSLKLLTLLAVATSIDAFAVGVSLAAMGAEIFSSAGIIALSTLLITLSALPLGKFAVEKLGDKSVILGGAVLVLIGIKSLF